MLRCVKVRQSGHSRAFVWQSLHRDAAGCSPQMSHVGAFGCGGGDGSGGGGGGGACD